VRAAKKLVELGVQQAQQGSHALRLVGWVCREVGGRDGPCPGLGGEGKRGACGEGGLHLHLEQAVPLAAGDIWDVAKPPDPKAGGVDYGW
jgi:hypothetical protein